MARIKSRVVIRKAKMRAAPPRQAEFAQHMRTSLIALGFLVCAAVLGLGVSLWRSGWVAEKTDAFMNSALDLTRRAGFSVNDILVEGRGQTDKEQILTVLNIEKGAPILGFDPHKALDSLSRISWVKSGVVERRLPGTIFVKLNEREPIAIWQLDKKLKLIDREGHVLRDVDADENMALLLVVGEGANMEADDLRRQLSTFPSLLAATKAATRVSNRRWNLLMENNITVKLPEENLPAALAQLDKVVREQDILKRSILGLDLRQQDRMIVETDKEIDPPKTAVKTLVKTPNPAQNSPSEKAPKITPPHM